MCACVWHRLQNQPDPACLSTTIPVHLPLFMALEGPAAKTWQPDFTPGCIKTRQLVSKEASVQSVTLLVAQI